MLTLEEVGRFKKKDLSISEGIIKEIFTDGSQTNVGGVESACRFLALLPCLHLEWFIFSPADGSLTQPMLPQESARDISRRDGKDLW